LLPAPLGASVIPGACIDGVGLWDSSTRVLREWGKPTRTKKTGPDILWVYPHGTVLLTRWGYEPSPNRLIVLVVSSTDPRQRTPAGIGVGSTKKALFAAMPNLRCIRAYCGRYDNRTGHSTDFLLKNGRVVEISVSLDSGYDDGPLQAPDRRCRTS
jgi:hypothetical protein